MLLFPMSAEPKNLVKDIIDRHSAEFNNLLQDDTVVEMEYVQNILDCCKENNSIFYMLNSLTLALQNLKEDDVDCNMFLTSIMYDAVEVTAMLFDDIRYDRRVFAEADVTKETSYALLTAVANDIVSGVRITGDCMTIFQKGISWISASYKGNDYTLSYNAGIDAMAIWQEVPDFEEKDCSSLKFIDYFHGGMGISTGELDEEYIMLSAKEYIDKASE